MNKKLFLGILATMVIASALLFSFNTVKTANAAPAQYCFYEWSTNYPNWGGDPHFWYCVNSY